MTLTSSYALAFLVTLAITIADPPSRRALSFYIPYLLFFALSLVALYAFFLVATYAISRIAFLLVG